MSLLDAYNQPRHKVFVSYHHANDQYYREYFEGLFSNYHDILVSKSVQIGDINLNIQTDTIRQKIRDEYLRDSTVTVVLIGSETWKRKHVDWEIGASIRSTQFNPRSGLLDILLPSYPRPYNAPDKYNHFTIPPRLHDNIQIGFSSIYNCTYITKSIYSSYTDKYPRRKLGMNVLAVMSGRDAVGILDLKVPALRVNLHSLRFFLGFYKRMLNK